MKIGIGIKVPSLSNLPGSSRPGSGSGGGVIPPSGEIFKFDTTTSPRSSKELACETAIDGFFFTTANPYYPNIIFVDKNSRVYIDAEATGYPEPGWYSQYIAEWGFTVYYVIGADGLVTENPNICGA